MIIMEELEETGPGHLDAVHRHSKHDKTARTSFQN